jgi:hypothetical protein
MIAVFRNKPFLAPTIMGTVVLLAMLRQSVQSASAKTTNVPVALNRSVQLLNRLYYKKDRQYAGRVVDLQQKHSFESGRVTNALRLRYTDGNEAWIAIDVAEKQFFMKRD